MSRVWCWALSQWHAIIARYWGAHLSAALRRKAKAKAKRPVKRRTP